MLHCTPREAKRRLTSSEFADYMEDFRQRDKERLERNEKWEYYAAGLIAEMRRNWVQKKGLIKNDQFLLRYTEEKDEEKIPISQEEKEARQLALEKYSWGVITGSILPAGTKRKK